MGIFVILITLLAFAAGHLRKELALTLLGAVFLTILVYCFAVVFFLGLIHRRRFRLISANVITKVITTGKNAEVRFSAAKRFFRFPGALVRYELNLETRDGREIRHIFDPGPVAGSAAAAGYNAFPVPERGAYFGSFDELAFFDIPGFFRLAFPIPQGDGDPRLLAVPVPAEEAVPIPIRSGGTEQRSESRFRRTEDLTDHRPYIPGDDPRRINWKLYGHGPSSELFVREGEREPPPHSRLLILLDTQADPGLYTLTEGRRAVDLLCSNALAAALEFTGRGIDVSLGYTGGKITGGNPAELTTALAWPAALPLNAPAEFPSPPRDQPSSWRAGIIILALPRTSSESSALDGFLKNRGPDQNVDLFFMYDEKKGGAPEEAAETCAALYGRKAGVHSRQVGV
jgi:uncharacterized protein (DUF58 family)